MKQEKKSKTLNSIRIGEQTFSNMQQALKKINEKNLFKITESDFRRMAYYYFSQKCLKVSGDTSKLIETD